MTLPPLYALRAFEVAARSGSFSKAAAQLNVTPGAISRHIRTLEAWFECELFHRNGPKVEVTAAGYALAMQLSEGFHRLDQACHAFRSGNRKLRLKSPSTLTMRWLLDVLSAFRQRHAKPEIEMTSVWMDTDSVDFTHEPYDCAILLGDGRFGAGTESRLLFEEWLVPVCSPAQVEQARMDMSRCELIHPSPDRRDWRRWLKRTGKFNELNIARGTVFDTLEQGIRAAISGHGISIGDALLCQAAIQSGQLALPFAEAIASGDGYWLVWPKHSARLAHITLLGDALKEAAPQQLPDTLTLLR